MVAAQSPLEPEDWEGQARRAVWTWPRFMRGRFLPVLYAPELGGASMSFAKETGLCRLWSLCSMAG
jgi:hypothetical protein